MDRQILLIFVVVPMSLMAVSSDNDAHAQDRSWPSQQGIVVWGDDPPMGMSGHCRSDGERIEQGQSQCLSVNGERYEAVCARTLNNTSWQRRGPCGS